MLVERTEGNLLAAHQELDKLRMQLGPGATVDAATVAISSSDSARFNARQIVDAVLDGDAARALRVTASLRAEGEDAVLILWALQTARVRLTSEAKDPRQRTAAMRLALRAWRADRMLKGRLHGVAWDEIALLTAELCGKRPLPLQRWQLRAS
jgi:DNA polymerase III delta subunit